MIRKAAKSRYSYQTYQNCGKTLNRELLKDRKQDPDKPDIIRHPMTLAKLFYDIFLKQNGILYADQVYACELCDPKDAKGFNLMKFSTWRKYMQEKRWLIHDNAENEKSAKYIPGKRLLYYLKSERDRQKESSTPIDNLTAFPLSSAQDKKIRNLEQKIKNLEDQYDSKIVQLEQAAIKTKELALEAKDSAAMALTYAKVAYELAKKKVDDENPPSDDIKILAEMKRINPEIKYVQPMLKLVSL
jgi:hypothetical protein